MSDYKTNSDIIREIRSRFLFKNFKEEPIDLNDYKGKLVIYAIKNITNGKLYIGKTSYFLNRVNHYIWGYRHPNDPSVINYPMTRIIAKEGIENFRMIPLCIVDSREDLAKLEGDYVSKLTSLGISLYNAEFPHRNAEKSMKGMKGTPHTIETKIKKAKWVVSINPDAKSMYICTGMKIFGDLVGTGKDMVKNCTRRGIKHQGFYLIYFGKNDRDEIKNERMKLYKAHLEWKTKHKPNYHNAKFEEYLSYVDLVEKMVESHSVKCFTDMGYKCEFLTYASSGKGETYMSSSITDYETVVNSL
jgi:hypothetical protein